MTFKEEIKNMSNKELIKEIQERGCDSDCYDSDYRGFWDVAMDELERRLGVKVKEIEEAIRYFKYGISYDIFSEDMIRIAKISIEALERMRDDIRR